MKMEDRPYQSKKKLMAMVRRGDYISINSSSKNGGSKFNETISDGNQSFKSLSSKLAKKKGALSHSSYNNINIAD